MQEMFTKDLEELKNKQTEMDNTLEGINSRITEAEEQMNDLEDRMVKITATEQNIEETRKRNEDSLQELWDNIKCTNIHIIGVPEGEGHGSPLHVLAWRIPGTVEPGGLPSMGSQSWI